MAVSEIGRPIATIGKRIEIADGPPIDPCTPITPINRPMSMLPLSPRKMQAGCQLYSKKPPRLPASATASTAASKFSLWIATRVSVPLTSRPTPEASPSMPSIRFQTFMQPRNQISVTSRLGTDRSNGESQPGEVDGGAGEVEVPAQELDRADAHAPEVQGEHGHRLAQQLHAGADRPGVVDEPHDEDHQRRDQQRAVARGPRAPAGPQAERDVQVGQQRAGGHADRQRQAAQARDRALVDPPEVIGPVDRPDAVRHPGDQRRRQHAAQHPEGEDRQINIGDHHESDHLPRDRSIRPGRGNGRFGHPRPPPAGRVRPAHVARGVPSRPRGRGHSDAHRSRRGFGRLADEGPGSAGRSRPGGAGEPRRCWQEEWSKTRLVSSSVTHAGAARS